MVKYPSTNILVSPLDDKNIRNLFNVKTYLEIKGESYYQNTDNPNRKDFHYFMGNSTVTIIELSRKVDIRIVASGEVSLTHIKTNLEKILNGD
jgi:hypothetical protein